MAQFMGHLRKPSGGLQEVPGTEFPNSNDRGTGASGQIPRRPRQTLNHPLPFQSSPAQGERKAQSPSTPTQVHTLGLPTKRDSLQGVGRQRRTPPRPKPVWAATTERKRRSGSPYGIRTRVTGVRGRRPRPLDERAIKGTHKVADLKDRSQSL